MRFLVSRFALSYGLLLMLQIRLVTAWGQEQARETSLPLVVSDADWQPMRHFHDRELQSALEARIRRNAGWSRLLDRQRMAVSVVDMTNPHSPKWAHVNGDVMMYAASLPKIAILLTAMDQIERGTLVPSSDVIQDMHAMIRRSSNRSATRMIDRVGGLKSIERVVTDPAYAFYDTKYGGGLWVGKRYSDSSTRNPDPLKGLSHAATANQVSRFYYLVAEGRLINPHRSAEMLSMLTDPGIDHKFVNTLRRIAPQARLFRKSGSWKDWHSDSALVWGPDWRHYIVVCLVEDPRGEQIMRDIIHVVEAVLRPPRKRSVVAEGEE